MDQQKLSRITQRSALVFRLCSDVVTLLVKTVPAPYHLLASVVTSTWVCIQDIYQDFKDGWDAV